MNRLLWLVLLVLLPAVAAAQVDVRFDSDGLAALAIGDENRLADGRPTVWRIMTGENKPFPGKQRPVIEFDSSSATHTTAYAWGKLVIRYEPTPRGVRLHGRIHNTSEQILGALNINLMALTSPGESVRPSSPTWGIEGPPLVTARGPLGTVAVSFTPGDPPRQVSLHQERGQWFVRITFGGDKLIVDNVPAEMTLKPGGELEFTVDVRLGSAGANPYELADDVIAAYRAAHPMRLNWPDRRPILRLFFGGGASVEEAVRNLKNPEAIVPPEPDPRFREQVLRKFRVAVEAAKAVNAQGYILWDLEGGTFPHAITYIGDPRLIRALNPQMDLVVDEGIKMLKDAGLHVGVTLRPSRVIYNPETNRATHSHTVAADPFRELDAKVQYARQRWGTTMFYVDTNFFWRPYGPDKVWKPGQLAPDVWERLQAKYPDTLFIPEFGNPADFAFTAPYGQADMGGWGTPELVRVIWPDAFRVIVIGETDFTDAHDRFVRTVRERNPLMTFPYSVTAPDTVAVGRIYEEAALLDAGEPQQVAGASGQDLIALLASPERATRFFAALKLRQAPVPQAVEPLLERLRDSEEAWVVRHAAARALAAMAPAQADEIMLEMLLDRAAGFHGAAHEFLVRRGQPARTALLARLEAMVKSGRAEGRIIDAIGKTLAALPEPADSAATIRDLYTLVPDGRNAPVIRRRLINILGLLRDSASESLLMTALDDPELRATAATALVRIGSEPGAARVRQLRDDAKAKGDQPLLDQMNQALRAK